MIRSVLVRTAVLTLSAATLHAQATEASARTVVPTFGFSVGSASITRDRAAVAQVGERSWGLQLEGGAIVKRFITFGFDLGGQFLDDHAQFTQNTTGGQMQSTANVTYLSAMTGLRTGALGPFVLAANVGFSGAMARRSIDNCSNCQVDKLKIPGGTFVEPALHIRVRKLEVRLLDRMFLSGDGLESVMSMGMQYAVPPKKR